MLGNQVEGVEEYTLVSALVTDEIERGNAVVIQLLAAGGQLIGFGWEARRDEPGREGTLQHVD